MWKLRRLLKVFTMSFVWQERLTHKYVCMCAVCVYDELCVAGKTYSQVCMYVCCVWREKLTSMMCVSVYMCVCISVYVCHVFVCISVYVCHVFVCIVSI